MMGQPRQTRNTYSVEDDLEEEERRGAGYIDELRRETYLPDSVHGSQRQYEAAVGGEDSIFFLGCAMCLWAPRSGCSVDCNSFFVKYFYSKKHLGSIRSDRR
jgi:hypothetical protein